MSKQSISTGLALVSFSLCVSCNSQQFATIPKIAKAIVDHAGADNEADLDNRQAGEPIA